MERVEFERLVGEAVRGLPQQFRQRMDNIVVVVKRRPGPRTLERAGVGPDATLLGLYRGVSLPDRAAGYNMMLPDEIIIYREPIVALCGGDPEQIVAQVRRTVVHEVGHYFGIGDAELERLGWG